MKSIKAFLQSKKDDIGFGDEDIDGLLRKKSMRCVEIPWVVLQFLKLRNKEKILDLGTSFFDRKYFKIFFETVILSSRDFYAIDFIPFNPERFSSYVNVDLLEKKIKFKRADIRHIPYPTNFFDLIFCISTIEHVGFDKINLSETKSSFDRSDELPTTFPSIESWNEDFKAIKEIIRILKPGGKLLLTVPFGKEKIIAKKDSQGLYALELQYDEKHLNKITKLPSIKVMKMQIFVYDNDRGWNDEIPPIIPSPKSAVACLEIEKVLK